MKKPNLKNVPFFDRNTEEVDDILYVDLMGPISPEDNQGNKYVLTMLDSFSRFAVAVPLPNKTAQTVTRAMTAHWLAPYGRPKAIYSDLGKEFTAAVT